MKIFLTAAAALAVLTSAGFAAAQPAPQRGPVAQRGPAPQRGAPPRRPPGADENYQRHADHAYTAPRYQPPRGYQAQQWKRGDHLPASYRSRSHVINYRTYGLGAPPRGYEYVRVGNDVVLTAIATGVISSVILQLFQ